MKRTNIARMIKIVDESKVTDYISPEELHNIMSNTKEFSGIKAYRQLDGMVIETTSLKTDGVFSGANGNRVLKYWKFDNASDGWKIYEIDKNGKKIGDVISL